MTQAVVRHIPADVSARLAELGLSIEPLLEAVLAGAAARNGTTNHHPATYPGMAAYAEATRVLRDQLVPNGWKAYRGDGLEGVLAPTGDVVIVVVSGNEWTGDASSVPKTKYPRGTASLTAIASNQLWLFQPPPQMKVRPKTWFLLTRQERDRVRCELSLPAEVNDDDFVIAWHERICLPSADLGPIASPAGPPAMGEEPEVDVPVVPRSDEDSR